MSELGSEKEGINASKEIFFFVCNLDFFSVHDYLAP